MNVIICSINTHKYFEYKKNIFNIFISKSCLLFFKKGQLMHIFQFKLRAILNILYFININFKV